MNDKHAKSSAVLWLLAVLFLISAPLLIGAAALFEEKVLGTYHVAEACRAAGIFEPVELKLDWPQPSGPAVDRVLAAGKPVLCVQLPRAPMGREDGFGHELLPDQRAVQRLIDAVKDVATVVQIGAGEPLHQLKGIDVDLANRTTIKELIDVVAVK